MRDYEAEKLAILAETDFNRLGDLELQYVDIAAAAARRDDNKAMNEALRLAYWCEFRMCDFTLPRSGMPLVEEHQHALVSDTTVEAFAAAIETDPVPATFDEAMTLAKASRGN